MVAKTSGGKRPSRRGRSASGRPTKFYFALALIAGAGVGGLAYVALRPSEAAVTPPPTLPANLAELGPPQPYALGPDSATVHVEEFADFECPSCARYATITEPDVRARIIETGRARFSYYDMPLPQHQHSYPASHAAACAAEQDRFWPMHDRIYEAQDRWSTGVVDNPKRIFRELARAVGLDLGRWDSCYDSRKYQRRIDANAAEAVRRGVNSTPTFIINGRQHRGGTNYDELSAAVQAAARTAAQMGDSAR